MNTTEKQLPDTYLVLSEFRKNDVYLQDMNKEEFITDFFPPTFPLLVQRLSDITGAFYAGMLKQTGELFGEEAIRKLSEAFFYDLGTKTALRNLNIHPNLTSSIPDMTKILLATVFTSSPEYNFEVDVLNKNQLHLQVKGIDRYHKATQQFHISESLEWPVIKDFIRGICDGMKLDVSFEMKVLQLQEDSSCHYELIVNHH
ncbi:hypothetical protein [Chryseobacterium sp. BIGb0232]|uniref:hypothetical protein n=1 Tax=Chryseobacterium sp. BIGb0232 TaxID=2940598 RepID=UPI000F476436|nr:hypothetical protein [Chryseobacterium sp. BIGb0232]MCS4300929.1 hypothetical protein [Chryseobacterium sp. BIGb0232]ROS20203.1 hypothetical protein EDF65_0908 [Chryseobacterium nakagawai]